jgi:selenocysteine-specific elongation factor
MYVLGTAGHVDHGKSTLVCALTGIDPDRLPEEKEREMTIDLGFAWFKLESGKEVSIVDVPGHEDFIKNMLAGVYGIDAALLIIAADEGVMQQTREHLAILDLLRVDKGIIVLTKKDLVDAEGLELARMEAEEAVKDTTLEGAPIIAVSSTTGDGIPELKTAISRLLEITPLPRDIGRPRLSIDRRFAMKGFGTVVTGTLIDGKLSVGQEVEILPPGLKAHIRGLETHKKKLDVAVPGSRVAVNLANVPAERIERGMVITTPGWLTTAQFVDVNLHAVKNLPRPVTHNTEVTFHSGTTEAAAVVRLLDKQKLNAGEVGWAQLKLDRPVAVAKDDFFIIRSPLGTVGGGQIVDINPRRHRRFQASLALNLQAKREGTSEDIILATLEGSGPSEYEKLLLACHLDEAEFKKALDDLLKNGKVIATGVMGLHQYIFSKSRWYALVKEVIELLDNYHAQFPTRRGMPKEELKSRLKIATAYFDGIIRQFSDDRVLVEKAAIVARPDFKVKFTAEQQVLIDAYLKELAVNPYSPTSPAEMNITAEMLGSLAADGKAVIVAEGVVFSPAAYEEMVKRVVAQMKKQSKITVAEVRDLFQTSRKYAIALMEYLDAQKVTRRTGNERVLC